MKFESVGFDLDGTLWNSLEKITQAWIEISKEYGVECPSYDKMKSVMGMNKHDLMTTLYPDMSENDKNIFFEKAAERCDSILKAQGGILFNNLEETLKYLSEKYKLYIVSNCQEGYIETFLEFHKLSKYFHDFQCAGKEKYSKGQNILRVLNRNDFTSSIYIGDTQGDCNAAKEAGIPFIFAEYGFGKCEGYDYSIKQISELKNML